MMISWLIGIFCQIWVCIMKRKNIVSADRIRFLEGRQKLIENSKYENKFFMTYQFPVFVKDWWDCNDLTAYYLPNAISQKFNCILEVVLAGIHFKSSKKTIPHMHVIGAASKHFFVDVNLLKDYLDERCMQLVSERHPNEKKYMYSKGNSLQCLPYNSNQRGIAYVYSHHALVGNYDSIFDRRHSQRRKHRNKKV